MVATGILPQATLALPCASRLLLRPRIKYGAGFEDKQKSCAIRVGYLLRVT
jgi:hypothetical protein